MQTNLDMAADLHVHHHERVARQPRHNHAGHHDRAHAAPAGLELWRVWNSTASHRGLDG